MLLAFTLAILSLTEAGPTDTSTDTTTEPRMSEAAMKAHLAAIKRYNTTYTDSLKARQGSGPPAYGDYWSWVKADGFLCWDNDDCTWIDEYLECQKGEVEDKKAKEVRWTGYKMDDVRGRCQCSDISYFYPAQLACRFAWWQYLLFVLAAIAILAVLGGIAACFLLPLFVVKAGDKEELIRQQSTTTHEGTKKTEGDEEEGQNDTEDMPAIEKPETKEYPSTYGEAIKNYKSTMSKVPKLARQESKHLSKTFPTT